MTQTILHIDSSARRQGSVTRDLTARIIAARPAAQVITRDLADEALPQVTETWVAANFTPEGDRTALQKDTLAQSDTLVDELLAADTVVIGLPIYNFGVPAALKAWVDLIARAGLSFRYTEAGPEGLLTGKSAILAVASGGVEAGSDYDLATPYMRQVLGFVGITDVTIVAADQMAIDPEVSLAKALAQVDALPKAA